MEEAGQKVQKTRMETSHMEKFIQISFISLGSRVGGGAKTPKYKFVLKESKNYWFKTWTPTWDCEMLVLCGEFHSFLIRIQVAYLSFGGQEYSLGDFFGGGREHFSHRNSENVISFKIWSGLRRFECLKDASQNFDNLRMWRYALSSSFKFMQPDGMRLSLFCLR